MDRDNRRSGRADEAAQGTEALRGEGKTTCRPGEERHYTTQDSAPCAVKCTPLASPPAAFKARMTAM